MHTNFYTFQFSHADQVRPPILQMEKTYNKDNVNT